MKKLQKLSTLVLAGACAVSMSAFAADADVTTIAADAGSEGIEDVIRTPDFAVSTGVVEELSDDQSTLLIKTETGVYNSLLANISKETVVVTAEGTVTGYSNIKIGDKVAVFHSNAVTMSLPAQSYASAVIINNDSAKLPALLNIGSAEKGDDGVILNSADGFYQITVNDETEISQHLTRNIITADDLAAGDTVLVWYGKSTKSIPEQAAAAKVLRFYKVVDLSDVEFTDAKPTEIGGVMMLPLRAIAEKMGAEIMWDAQNGKVTVVKDGMVVSVTPNSTTAHINDKEITIDLAPILHNDRTMVSQNFFEDAFRVQVTL